MDKSNHYNWLKIKKRIFYAIIYSANWFSESWPSLILERVLFPVFPFFWPRKNDRDGLDLKESDFSKLQTHKSPRAPWACLQWRRESSQRTLPDFNGRKISNSTGCSFKRQNFKVSRPIKYNIDIRNLSSCQISFCSCFRL